MEEDEGGEISLTGGYCKTSSLSHKKDPRAFEEGLWVTGVEPQPSPVVVKVEEWASNLR